MDVLPNDARLYVLELYRMLGGIQDRPVLTPNGWDCPVEGGLVVELDELQHFNRYRALTLQYPHAHGLPWRTTYFTYCTDHETDCLRSKASGGFWSTPKSEAMFGTPSAAKTLDGVGSPRWKQRALYDAMRDIAATSGVVRLARVSVFDPVGGVPLRLALDGRVALDVDALRELVVRRTVAG